MGVLLVVLWSIVGTLLSPYPNVFRLVTPTTLFLTVVFFGMADFGPGLMVDEIYIRQGGILNVLSWILLNNACCLYQIKNPSFHNWLNRYYTYFDMLIFHYIFANSFCPTAINVCLTRVNCIARHWILPWVIRQYWLMKHGWFWVVIFHQEWHSLWMSCPVFLSMEHFLDHLTEIYIISYHVYFRIKYNLAFLWIGLSWHGPLFLASICMMSQTAELNTPSAWLGTIQNFIKISTLDIKCHIHMCMCIYKSYCCQNWHF